jgi:hypothetical protein
MTIIHQFERLLIRMQRRSATCAGTEEASELVDQSIKDLAGQGWIRCGFGYSFAGEFGNYMMVDLANPAADADGSGFGG